MHCCGNTWLAGMIPSFVVYLLLCTSIAHGVTLYDGKHFLQVSTCEKSSMTMGAGGEQQHIPACD